MDSVILSGNPDADLQSVEQMFLTDPAYYGVHRVYLLQAWLLEKTERPADALALYKKWQERDKLFRDYMLMQAAAIQVGLARGEEARQSLYRLMREFPKSPYYDEACFRLAKSYADDGKWILAASGFTFCIQKTKNRREESRLYLLRVRVAQKKWPEAVTLLTPLLSRHGSSRIRLQAAILAVDTPLLQTHLRRTEKRLADVVDCLLTSRELERSLPLIQALVNGYPASRDHARYLWWLGRWHYLSGLYDQAMSWYQKAAAAGDKEVAGQSRRSMARTLSLRGQPDRALELLQSMRLEPGEDPAEISLDLFTLSRRLGKAAQAIAFLRSGLDAATGTTAVEIRYRLALAVLQNGDPAGAIVLLDRVLPELAEKPKGLLPDRAEAAFFLGLAYERAGHPEQAARAWTAHVFRRESAFSFLAAERARALFSRQPDVRTRLLSDARQALAVWRAAGKEAAAFGELARFLLLADSSPGPAESIAGNFPFGDLLAGLASVAPLPLLTAGNPPERSPTAAEEAFFRAQTFQRLGLAAPAAVEYGRCRERDLLRRLKMPSTEFGRRRAFTLARLYSRNANPFQAFVWARRLLDSYPDATPFHLLNRDILMLCYPVPHRSVILGACREFRVPPSLALSVMLQESRFDPEAHSPVAARGLMQLMPETARRLAALDGAPLRDVTALYTSGLNVRLGIRYLRQLLDLLGPPVAAAAAYNAGENQTGIWKTGAGEPLDYFLIPEIEFAQTRQYVNHVLANSEMYRWIYPDLDQALDGR